MEIYLLTFVVSSFLYKLSEDSTKSIFRLLYLCLAILIPSLLAGYRDNTVGHDLLAYAVPCFETCRELRNIYHLGEYMLFTGLEPLYVLYTYIITRITSDIFWFYFIQMLLCLGLVAILCYRLRRSLDAPLLYFVFLIFCFCTAMSMNRQIFAVCIIFWGYYYVLKQELWKFVVCILVAQFFHNSAIFAFPIYFIYKYIRTIQRDISYDRQLFLLGLGLGFVVIFPLIISFFLQNGLINAKYERYMNADYNTHKIDIIFIACVYCMAYINTRLKFSNNVIKLFCIIIFILMFCGIYNDVATRVAMYYQLFLFICILRCAKKVPSYSRWKYDRILAIGVLIVFVYTALTTGYAEAIPYTSKTLGI